jgi:hypothetical protein
MKDFPNLRIVKKIGNKYLLCYETENTQNYAYVYTNPESDKEWIIDLSNPIDERKYHMNISKTSKMGIDIMLQIIELDENESY